MSSELAISARSLTKAYHIYAHPQDRLKQMLWRGHRTFYREFIAVRDVDLDVYRGETVGVIGRNGSGKSTLLKMLCRTLEPTAGELEVRGRVAPILALGAGFNPEFTGRENVLVNAAVLGISDAQLEARLDSIVAFADIGEFFDRVVKSYSSGMYSRLAFAVAIHTDPDILVVDEVLAVGDEAFTRKCFARIEELKAGGATILFVSHAINLIAELCDRVLVLEAGERLLTADPKTAISRYHELLYSPKSEYGQVVERIRALDRDPYGAGRAHPTAPAGDSTDGQAAEADEGEFEPALVPQSTVEYERRGCRIEGPRILDSRGRQVNVLRAGRTYTYAYEVRFAEPAYRVRFGMMLKLVSGLELAGQASHPNGQAIDHVEAETVAHVRFEFRTQLTPGTYFLNAGVLGFVDGGEHYLHRVLDAAVFRIDPDEPSCVTGRVDLSTPARSEVRLTDATCYSGPE